MCCLVSAGVGAGDDGAFPSVDMWLDIQRVLLQCQLEANALATCINVWGNVRIYSRPLGSCCVTFTMMWPAIYGR